MVGIGFFAPLPLALMMPFMAGQSMMMGDAFGKAYQYGKRKISAMTNEEFNKLTTGDLGREILTDYTAIIPSMTQAIKQSTAFQSFIIHELAEIVKNLPKDLVEGLGVQPTSPQAIIQNYRPTSTDREPSGLITQQQLLDFLKGLIPSVLQASGSHPETITTSSPTSSSVLDSLAFIQAQIEQAEKDKNIHGPTLTQKTPPQSPNTLVVNPDGSLTNIDVRGTAEDPRKITLPVSKVVPTTQNKRKAGQSQIRERATLTHNIQAFQKQINYIKANPIAAKRIEQNTGKNLATYTSELNDNKRKLADLLARYRF